ncbi:MAG: hypothetical protein CL812_04970 [Confluentimicrobium sp.]|nr:hypothetical protein [Actibacterium sp.]MAQ45201.1 hypothetical protein [Actibacterium sp.]
MQGPARLRTIRPRRRRPGAAQPPAAPVRVGKHRPPPPGPHRPPRPRHRPGPEPTGRANGSRPIGLGRRNDSGSGATDPRGKTPARSRRAGEQTGQGSPSVDLAAPPVPGCAQAKRRPSRQQDRRG